jgi:hypothetical protein
MKHYICSMEEQADNVILFNKTDNEIIDVALKFIAGRRAVTIRDLSMIPNDRKKGIVTKMVVNKRVIISMRQTTSYNDDIVLGDEGLKILSEYGSFLKFVEYNEKESQKTKEKHDLEVKALNNQITTNNFNRWIAIISIIVSLIALGVSIYTLTK